MEKPISAPINIYYPASGDLHLRLSVGACRLRLRPHEGEGEAWVSGSYTDPTGAIPFRIHQEGGTVRLNQEFNFPRSLELFSGVPTFDLTLSKGRPFMLTIEGGASENYFELGGLPVTRLQVRVGAGKYEVNFGAPNPQPMSYLYFGAGAGSMEVKNLANANFAEMSIEGGAASYKFDFGGNLQRDGHVRISTAMSAVEIRVPAATAARISAETMMGSFNVGDGFTKWEGAFWTVAAQSGQTPVLSISTNVALGSLNLRTGVFGDKW